MQRLISFLTLFGSFSTLICCAIPALLVSIGLGTTVVATVSAFPQLVWLSEHKATLYLFAGALLVGSFLVNKRAKRLSCPTDPQLANACAAGKNYSGIISWISWGLYIIGGIFAFGGEYLAG